MNNDKELSSQVLALKELHYLIRGFLDRKDYEGLKSWIQRYLDNPEINELKTIQIVLRGIEVEPVKTIAKKVNDLFDIEYDKLKRQP